MENVVVEPQTRTPRVVNRLIHERPREVAARFEVSLTSDASPCFAAHVYADELGTLTFVELMRKVAARLVVSEEHRPAELAPIGEFRMFATESGRAALMGVVENLSAPRE